ncbi:MULTISPECIES: ABC transporter substrate-binding protein [Afipia]|jgi:branched-chain amino acid transport system substrate-binding protein|uniref:Branched-chain amino acid transport system substrate-binding protein n=1 Tax=Afipia massiliensis TaxID=211460 RepID=A0A840NEW5_9BRAD|nr:MULTISPECIES: ABC transporter substrate-binding protein [Afipia]MBB5055226.1 branched-chain amino acid transport system substrate-binding protein [Afipia massiliensis]
MPITRTKRLLSAAISTLSLLGLAQTACAQGQTFKLGIVTFTSGPGAESFGVPAWNSAKMLADAFNQGGQLPPPYDKIGLGGLKVEASVIDENGGTTKQVQELRNAYDRDGYDAVIGYISSSNCLAGAPVAEELKKILILFDCGTPRIFEDNKYRYVFRATAHATMDNVAMARYIAKRKLKSDDVGGINPDYAYGRDNWKDFQQSMVKLNDKAKIKSELWPKFGAGQYGTEISALLQANPQIVHTSLWGGDLQAFILQGAPRNLFKDRHVAIIAADHVFQPLGSRMPNDVLVGARGENGPFAAKSALNDWFVAAYEKQFAGQVPSQAPYRMAQSVLALKLAVDKAAAANGGKKPTADQIADALTGLEWEAPSGRIKMALGDGHQAIQANAIGLTKWNPATKRVEVVEVERFAAECVNPPVNVKSEEWIAQGFPEAKCN